MRNLTQRVVVLVGLLAVLGGCETAGSRGLTSPTTIHQEVVIKAPPHRVYQALTDAKEFETLTGMHVIELHPEAGTTFSLFGGLISGRQVVMVPDQRIVEAWHEDVWGPGVYSIARFELKAEGEGTRIVFDHRGFPEGAGPHLTIGWKEHYWDRLAKYVER